MNKIEYIIGKEALECLFKTVEQLAAKVGIDVTYHGAVDIINKIKGAIREHESDHKEDDNSDEEEIKG